MLWPAGSRARRAAIWASAAAWLALLAPGRVPAAESTPHQLPRNPSSAKECAICHYRWVDTFFLDGRGTDLVPLQTEPVVGTSGMCFSCHDGSVMDSRWAFEKEHGHKIGVTPPATVNIPAVFPLDTNGQIQCVTCHSPHGVPSVVVENTSSFLRVENTNSSMCLMCHPTLAGNVAGANHPMGQVTNPVPRELWSRHVPPTLASQLITCETCHIAHGDPQQRLLKQSVADSTLCLTCHADKNPINADGTRNLLHAVNVVPTNAIIPATLLTNGAKLGRNDTLTCLTCHKVHQNRIEKHLLVAPTDNQSTFCLNCHRDQQVLLQNKHNLAATFPDAKNLAGLSVTEAGPCSACHLPHRNALPLAGRGDAVSTLCLACHGATGMATRTNLLGRSHPVDVPLTAAKVGTRAAASVSLPLFDSLRRRVPDGKMNCLTCHDAHRAQPDGAPTAPQKFLRKTAPALCVECHQHQTAVQNTKHDLNKTAPTARNLLGQTLAESGICAGCHLVHSPTNSTWALALPNSSNPAEKCRSCHRPGGLAEKKQTGAHSHSIDKTLFEAGLKTSLPLYTSSTRTNAPGQMTCTTCHDPHQWNPALVAATGDPSIDGNPQNSFLRLPAAPTPTLCVDCHTHEAMVVRTEHDLALFAPGSTNLLGQRASNTGPCGACHLTHNAPTEAKLWARDLGPPSPGAPVVDQMCQSCHASQGLAANKVPAFATHPLVTVVNLPASTGYDRSFFPMFDPVSGKLVKAGTISCSSCHNVHQWSLATPGPGPGRNTEGDSNNSFLRHRSTELPCKICHGLDSIYRYQYYHKSSTHRAKEASLPREAIP